MPLVYFRITNDTSLPSIGEVKDIEYIKLAVGERNPNIIYEYRGKLLNTSKRVIPKSLTYLGNTDVIYPESEFIPKHDVSYPYFEWKRIEGKIIRRNEKRKQ